MKYECVCLVTQLCQTLCNPTDCSPPDFSVHGILQARILERVAFPFSKGSSAPSDRTQVSRIADRFFTIWSTKWKKVKSLSHVRLFAIPWTVACNRLLCPWDFLGKSTRVSYHFLLQGIFPTQGWNPGLPNCRQTLYHLSHQGSPAREVYMGTVYFWNFSKIISKPKWKNNTV